MRLFSWRLRLRATYRTCASPAFFIFLARDGFVSVLRPVTLQV